MLRRKRGIYDDSFKAQLTEQFRTIRTNIRFSARDKAVKAITVTSCNPGEGKSTVIANLALSMAQTGKTVVILDCDLKKPTIHKKFNLNNDEGLTNVLVGDRSLEEVIKAPDFRNIHIVTSGPIPPNSSELLNTSCIREIVNELSCKYDMVLLDTPPVLYISDALILSAVSQGTILVCVYGKTDMVQFRRAKEVIEKAGGKILGAVVNKAPKKYGRKIGKYYSGI